MRASLPCLRGVAQPGSALDWGSSGRWFKSSHPDQAEAVQDGTSKLGLPRFGRPSCLLCADCVPISGRLNLPASLQWIHYASKLNHPAPATGGFYIGRSGTKSQMGTPGWQTLPERLNNDQSKGEWREAFFKRRMDELDLEGFDITWALLLAGGRSVLPALAEAWLLQTHLHTYGRLPLHNKNA